MEKLPFTGLELAMIEQALRMLDASNTYNDMERINQIRWLTQRIANSRTDGVKRIALRPTRTRKINGYGKAKRRETVVIS